MMTMIELHDLGPRIGIPAWRFFQADELAARRRGRDRSGFYSAMLKDDLRNRRYAYEVGLEASGTTMAHARDVLLRLLDDFDRVGYGDDPASLVCDLAAYLLEESLSSDYMLMELHLLDQEALAGRGGRRRRGGEGRPSGLPSLGFLPAWSVAESALGVRQVPAEDGQPEVFVPARRVLRLQLGKHNRRAWRQAARRLREVDDVKSVGADMSRLAWRGYDFSEQVKAQELAVASATAVIGWDGRGTFSKWTTSPYITHRELRFVRFWVEAVDDVVRFLNGVTGSPSLYGDGHFGFAVTGLPSVEELERAMDDVRAGQLTVGDARTRFLSPRYSRRRSAEEG